MPDMSLGQRIKEVRLQKKMTQSDVVGEYMTRNMLSKIENGSAAPSVRTLEFLATALDVPVSYFLDGEERETVDTEQLREVEELVMRLEDCPENMRSSLALCIRGRCRLAAGKIDAALELCKDLDEDKYPAAAQHDIYAVLEDCYKMKGNFKLAYEYALRRLKDYEEHSCE